MRVVLDTNVFISAGLNWTGPAARVVWAFREGRFTLVTSEPLLAELEEVLLRTELAAKVGLTPAEVTAWLALLRERAILVPVTGEIRVCRDPDDDAVIETAMRGAADLIVTRDQDLTQATEVAELLSDTGVRVVTVAQFLAGLDASEPDQQE